MQNKYPLVLGTLSPVTEILDSIRMLRVIEQSRRADWEQVLSFGRPVEAITGKRLTGLNAMHALSVAVDQNLTSNSWVSIKSVLSAGALPKESIRPVAFVDTRIVSEIGSAGHFQTRMFWMFHRDHVSGLARAGGFEQRTFSIHTLIDELEHERRIIDEASLPINQGWAPDFDTCSKFLRQFA